MRVSRGESLDKQDTMINLQKESNEIFQPNNNKEKPQKFQKTQNQPTVFDNLTGLQFEMG